jgi:hypothetical protein
VSSCASVLLAEAADAPVLPSSAHTFPPICPHTTVIASWLRNCCAVSFLPPMPACCPPHLPQLPLRRRMRLVLWQLSGMPTSCAMLSANHQRISLHRLRGFTNREGGLWQRAVAAGTREWLGKGLAALGRQVATMHGSGATSRPHVG